MTAGDRDGNYFIRFEPTAVLQTQAQIPFEIHVDDARHQPLVDAKVTLQIETKDHTGTQTFKAPAVGKGVYVAKPVFPSDGEWNVLVAVRRDDAVGARTIPFTVPK
jgi:hypothetical protein